MRAGYTDGSMHVGKGEKKEGGGAHILPHLAARENNVADVFAETDSTPDSKPFDIEMEDLLFCILETNGW